MAEEGIINAIKGISTGAVRTYSGGSSLVVRVRNNLPEDVTQSMNPSWPINDMYNSLAVGAALNEEDNIQ